MLAFAFIGWTIAVLAALALGVIIGIHIGIDMEQQLGGDDNDV